MLRDELRRRIKEDLDTWPPGFMEPQVWEAPRVWRIETPHDGDEIIDEGWIVALRWREGDAESVEFIGSRVLATMSAPGYMDRSDIWLIDDERDWEAFVDAYRPEGADA